MTLKNNFNLPRKRTLDLVGLILGLLFALYNGVFGILFDSLWHIEISVYYTLLLIVKTIVFKGINVSANGKALTRIFVSTSILLVLLNISLAFPIASMLRRERVVAFPLEIAIGIAAYTTYKVTVTVISFMKTRKTDDLLLRESVTIRSIETIVSVLTLQHTLISVNGGDSDEGLLILSVTSSAVGFLAIQFLIVRMIIQYSNRKR